MKTALVSLSLAAIAATSITAGAASAQDYGYHAYDAPRDACAQVQHNRGTSGALLGALAGAALGSNLASHHGGRSGGAILGALAGAAVGNNIGRSSGQQSAPCQVRDDAPAYYAQTSGGYGYGYGYGGGYDADRRVYRDDRGDVRADDLNSREARLNLVIRREQADGDLTGRDARIAWRTLGSIQNQHRDMLARDGGWLTQRDRLVLNGRLDDLARFVRSADFG